MRSRRSQEEALEDEIHQRTMRAYAQMQNRFPMKEILRAAFLFTFGAICLTIGSLMYTGYIPSDFWEKGIPLLVIGSLCFLPGSYICFIAVQTYRGVRGYSYGMIPSDG
jgi:hypothetical protein